MTLLSLLGKSFIIPPSNRDKIRTAGEMYSAAPEKVLAPTRLSINVINIVCDS
jgi:hypothetical protein